MEFKVTARRSGDSASFMVEALDTRDALQKARTEANRVFDYHSGTSVGAPPTVSVVPIIEKEK